MTRRSLTDLIALLQAPDLEPDRSKLDELCVQASDELDRLANKVLCLQKRLEGKIRREQGGNGDDSTTRTDVPVTREETER